MKIIVLIISFLMTLNFALAAGAGKEKHQRGEFFKKELNLTEEQLTKVKEIKKEHKEKVRTAKKKFKDAKKEFKEAMRNSNLSKDELKAKFENFQSLRDDFQRKRFHMMLEMRGILTPDQMVKYNAMKEKKFGKKGKHKRK